MDETARTAFMGFVGSAPIALAILCLAQATINPLGLSPSKQRIVRILCGVAALVLVAVGSWVLIRYAPPELATTPRG